MKSNNTKLFVGIIALILLIIIGFIIYWFYFRTSVIVNILPEFAIVEKGKTQKFTATVKGATNTAVDWSVDNPSLGVINPATGVFTASASSGAVVVSAKSKEDPTIIATAKVTLDAAQTPAPGPTGSTGSNGSTGSPGDVTGPTGSTCIGKDITRCGKLDATRSRDVYTPFEMMCANGEHIETLSVASDSGLHGIGGQCTGSTGTKFFGGLHGHTDFTVGWQNGKPPVGGYQRIQAWAGSEWDSVGKIIIYDKNGNQRSFATRMNTPETNLDCGRDGVITGIYGTSNTETNMINTLGIYCGYTK